MEKDNRFFGAEHEGSLYIKQDGIQFFNLEAICDLIDVKYDIAVRNAMADGLLSDHLTLLAFQGKEVYSLPEFYVFGWIIQQRSKSSMLIDLKRMAYNYLGDYFSYREIIM